MNVVFSDVILKDKFYQPREPASKVRAPD